MQEVLLFGDSVAQGIVLDENGNYRISRTGCVRLLKRGGFPIRNYAVHGYTVLQGIASFRGTQADPGSGCVIEFGGNDCDLDWDAVSEKPDIFHDGRVPLENFRAGLEAFITEARKKSLRPILVTPLALMSGRYFRWVSRGRDRDNILKYLKGDPESISRWQERYATVVRETAVKMDCPLVDVRFQMLDQPDYPDLICEDGIHPSEKGHAVLAELIGSRYRLSVGA